MTIAFEKRPESEADASTKIARSILATRVGFCLIVMWAILALIGVETRRYAWNDAAIFGTDVAFLVETAVAREFESYDLSIRALAIDAADPAIQALPPTLKRKAMFDRSANASDLGVMVVLDETGRAVDSSKDNVAAGIDYSDREYFKVQRADPNAGLYVGGPFLGRITHQASLGLSRRRRAIDGRFAGVVVGTIQLSFFGTLFGSMHLPPGSSMTLMKRDGTILTRMPFRDHDVGLNVMTGVLDEALTRGDGLYRRISASDGVDRLFAIRQVGKLPLYVTVGLSTEQILSNWRWETLLTGIGFALLSAIIVLLGINLAGELRRRGEAERRLGELASTDYLTLLANRRRFDERLDSEWRRCARSRSALSLLMVDGDFFKSFNDTYGHLEGDRVLRMLAVALKTCADRPGDLVARYGGEEFAVLLPATDIKGALAVAAAIRAAIDRLDLIHALAPTGRMTVSIGVSCRVPDVSLSSETLVEAADAALYLAKGEGRDRIVAEGQTGQIEARRVA